MIEPYDIIKDELTLCNSEEETKQLINTYGVRLAQKYLPEKYLYLIKDNK
jgi:hypothetical protein